MPSPSKPMQSLGTTLFQRLQQLPLRVILAVAGVLRIISIFVFRTYLHPDTWEFSIIARFINQGLGFSYMASNNALQSYRIPSALMPPAYPFFLAGLYRAFGERPATYLGIEFLNAALGVLLVYMIYRTARNILSETAAKLAALICAVYPAQVYSCNEFHSISFYIVLGVAVVFFLNRFMDESASWKDALWAGICMGFVLLFRAEAMAIMFLYSLCLILRKGWKALVPAVLFAAVSLLFLSPWIIRNALVFNAFVPTMSTPGFNLWLGNNPTTTGSNHFSWDHAREAQPGLLSELSRVPVDAHYEVEVDKVYKKYALNFIRTHPRVEVKLAARKLFLFFFFDPSHDKSSSPLYWVPSVLMSCVAAFGVYFQRRRLLRQDLLLTVTIAYAVLIGMVMFVLPRYKMVVDPFIMIFAAAVVDRYAPSQASGNRSGTAAAT